MVGVDVSERMIEKAKERQEKASFIPRRKSGFLSYNDVKN